MSRGIAVLKNRIQEYAWGSKTFIPKLTGETCPAERPCAEMWMGAHPGAPSTALYGYNSVSLDELIADDPSGTLGPTVAEKFSNTLPFLFKVLAAERPLSIQAHPDKTQAATGFNRENSRQLDLDDPHRNYRDDNHKPELVCALEPMWVLKGFREIKEIIGLGDRMDIPSWSLKTDILKYRPDKEGLKAFFTGLMNMDKREKQSLLEGVKKSLGSISSPDPAFKWIKRLNEEYPGDIGSLSPLFLNVVRLGPKDAMFIPSGELHAYLAGSGLEIMANSDNVLRGGLTSKHIDVPEFLKILDFSSRAPEILRPGKQGDPLELAYPVTAEEFMLSLIFLNDEGSTYYSPVERSAEIIICIDGHAVIKDKEKGVPMEIKRGTSMFIPASIEQYIIQGKATIYKASVPL